MLCVVGFYMGFFKDYVSGDWAVLANSLLRRFMEPFLPFAFGDWLCSKISLLEVVEPGTNHIDPEITARYNKTEALEESLTH